jgi:hypothetical protein
LDIFKQHQKCILFKQLPQTLEKLETPETLGHPDLRDIGTTVLKFLLVDFLTQFPHEVNQSLINKWVSLKHPMENFFHCMEGEQILGVIDSITILAQTPTIL